VAVITFSFKTDRLKKSPHRDESWFQIAEESNVLQIPTISSRKGVPELLVSFLMPESDSFTIPAMNVSDVPKP
jgi:hypothetical protein